MNSFERERDGKRILANREIFQKDSIFWWNAKHLGIKAVATVVLLPCAIELGLAASTEIMAENLCGLAMPWERDQKEVTNPDFGCGWIRQGGDFVGKRGTECSGCGTETVLPFTRDGEPMRDKPRETSASNGKQPEVGSVESDTENVHPSIWVWVAIIFASLFAVPTESKKSNSLARRLLNLRASPTHRAKRR